MLTQCIHNGACFDPRMCRSQRHVRQLPVDRDKTAHRTFQVCVRVDFFLELVTHLLGNTLLSLLPGVQFRTHKDNRYTSIVPTRVRELVLNKWKPLLTNIVEGGRVVDCKAKENCVN